MIYESEYWKDDLLRSAKILKEKKRQKYWRSSSFALVEKTIFVSFYSIRKLYESHKVSGDNFDKNIEVFSYPTNVWSNENGINFFSRYNNHFKMHEPSRDAITVKYLCNQVIHSYFFEIEVDIGLDSILVASDFDAKKRIRRVSVDTLINVFESIGNDYPSRIEYDSKRNKPYLISR